jgi:hypothetical protein
MAGKRKVPAELLNNHQKYKHMSRKHRLSEVFVRPPFTVFFDAAQAALWGESTIHRTGVGRVTVGLLRAFAERDGIRLVLACPAGMDGQVALFIQHHHS